MSGEDLWHLANHVGLRANQLGLAEDALILAIPVIIEGGAWAIAAWRAWRLAATATAIVGGAYTTNQGIEGAQKDA
jgi:hypothetical protein